VSASGKAAGCNIAIDQPPRLSSTCTKLPWRATDDLETSQHTLEPRNA